MSFHIDTDLFDADTDWAGDSYRGAKDKTLKKAKVDSAVLQADTEYKLYAVSGDPSISDVHTLLTFRTDQGTGPDSGTFYNTPVGYTYTVKAGESFLLRTSFNGSLTGLVRYERIDGSDLAFVSHSSDNGVVPNGGRGKTFYSSQVESSPTNLTMLSTNFDIELIGVNNAGEGNLRISYRGMNFDFNFIVQ